MQRGTRADINRLVQSSSFQRGAFALVTAIVGVCGCGHRQYQAECETTVKALGVGFENVDSPPTDEPTRQKQLARMTEALTTWSSSKASVTLADLRAPADALVGPIEERKALLQSAKLDRAALVANGKTYHERFEAVMSVCIAKGR